MADPHRGSRTGSTYRLPANAILAHPGLLLLVAGLGVLLVVLSPRFCGGAFDQYRCTADLALLGWSVAALGLVSYAGVQLYRLVASD